jgi:hypothetical protein
VCIGHASPAACPGGRICCAIVDHLCGSAVSAASDVGDRRRPARRLHIRDGVDVHERVSHCGGFGARWSVRAGARPGTAATGHVPWLWASLSRRFPACAPPRAHRPAAAAAGSPWRDRAGQNLASGRVPTSRCRSPSPSWTDATSSRILIVGSAMSSRFTRMSPAITIPCRGCGRGCRPGWSTLAGVPGCWAEVVHPGSSVLLVQLAPRVLPGPAV